MTETLPLSGAYSKIVSILGENMSTKPLYTEVRTESNRGVERAYIFSNACRSKGSYRGFHRRGNSARTL